MEMWGRFGQTSLDANGGSLMGGIKVSEGWRRGRGAAAVGKREKKIRGRGEGIIHFTLEFVHLRGKADRGEASGISYCNTVAVLSSLGALAQLLLLQSVF